VFFFHFLFFFGFRRLFYAVLCNLMVTAGVLRRVLSRLLAGPLFFFYCSVTYGNFRIALKLSLHQLSFFFFCSVISLSPTRCCVFWFLAFSLFLLRYTTNTFI
jgi:hypothetical protein